MPVTYKCPNCGGAMEFDSASQKLACGLCGTQIDVPAYERLYAAHQAGADRGQGDMQGQQHAETREEFAQQQVDMKIYHCQSCGAELVADRYTSATFCSFCGNPTLVEDRLQGAFSPSTIIPFKINREQAVDIYKKWLKKGWLTPKALSVSSTIEKISGVYVPFWLYNYSARTIMNAKAERVRTQRRGDTEYIYTDHFQVFRDVSADFERIPADASEKMPDGAMDKLEPYNYAEMTPFSFGYLSGYLSERYNYTADEMQNRVKQRANQYITDIARNSIIGYSGVTILRNDISMIPTGEEYALFPVWMLNFRFNNKNFQFFLNGQTGKIVADRPISKTKTVVYSIVIFVVTLIITMIGGLLL